MTEKKLKLKEIEKKDLEIETLALKISKKYTKNKDSLRKILISKVHFNWTLKKQYNFLYNYGKNT